MSDFAGINLDSQCLVAIPKKGRLFSECLKIIKGINLEYIRPSRLDYARCKNIDITLVFLPAHDIPHYVSDGIVDMGITGLDMIKETGADVKTEMELGFGKCDLCVLAPKVLGLKSSASVVGKRIVTSFPNISKVFFDEVARKMGDAAPTNITNIRYVSGSVEVACTLGLADAVVDLVETGTTMRAAGLEVVDVIMKTQSVLISNLHTKHAEMVKKIAGRIKGHMTAQSYVLLVYNCPRKVLTAAIKVTPGKRSPSLIALEEKGWVAVSVLVKKPEVSNIMDELDKLGATDMLVTALTNCRV